MRRRSKRRAPFVITFAALAGGVAVGCESTSDGGAQPNQGESVCPTPSGFTSALYAPCDHEGARCRLEITCHSGPVALSLQCKNGTWYYVPTKCEHVGDECSPRF